MNQYFVVQQTLASVYANSEIEYAQVYVDDFVGNKILLETILPEANEDE